MIREETVFGPIFSRRLGSSLGINLLPVNGKICTFDCIYCECGLNAERRPKLPRPTREEVAEALEKKLQEMAAEGQLPDVLTFAGNGEPTTHPHFADIIADTIRLRDQYCPEAKVSVLSNATQLHRRDVFEALLRVDNNIQKLDTVDADFIRAVDRPTSPNYDVAKVVEQLKAFKGKVIIQTIWMKIVNCQLSTINYNDESIRRWLSALKKIAPQSVMIYTIDRETPVKGLEKATPEELNRIRDLVIAEGIPCTASY